MSIDEQFVEFVIKSLVTKPDAVKIERRIDEKGVLLELTVDPEDLGRVIGKRGATAQSVRTLLRALGTKNDARYNLKIVDNGIGSGAAAASSRSSDDNNTNTSNDNDSTDSSDDVWSAGSNSNSAGSDDDTEDISVDSTDSTNNSDADEEESDVVAKTRRELKDLDDLDV